jgi:hypothetical protein
LQNPVCNQMGDQSFLEWRQHGIRTGRIAGSAAIAPVPLRGDGR